MNIETIIVLIFATVFLSIALASVQKVRKQIDALRLHIHSFGWKYLENQGPPLLESLSDIIKRQVIPHHADRSVILFSDVSCGQCNAIGRTLPALLDDIPGLHVSIVSHELHEPIGHRRTHANPRISYHPSEQLVQDLNFKIAPCAVYVEQGVPIRKGIVNNLEQIRLLVDPSQVEMDLLLR